MEKWNLVQWALHLDPEVAPQLQGRPVLLLDDNVTDGITFWVARNRLLEAGASEVGLVTLTQTIRTERALGWKLR